MAVTTGKKKARLDFSSMVESAVPPIDTKEPETVAAEEVRSAEPLAAVEPALVEPIDKEKPAQSSPEAIQDTEDPAKEPDIEKQEKPRKTSPQTRKPREVKREEEEVDDIDAMLSMMQTGRGVQKSVYLDEDVYNYIQAKGKKTNAKLSNVLNLLVRAAIKQQNKK